MNGVFSDWIEPKRGVSQCTVLCPLFKSYIYEIQTRISQVCTLVQYADDCMILASSLSSNDALNQFQNSLGLILNCNQSVQIQTKKYKKWPKELKR